MSTVRKKKYKDLILLTLLVIGASVDPSFSQQSTNFIQPQDNSYSLRKVFTAPYLQFRPIKKIWESGINSKKLENDLNRAIIPEQIIEQHAESLFWRTQIQSKMDELNSSEQEIEEYTNDLSQINKATSPELTAIFQARGKEIDDLDLQITNAYLSFENNREIEKDLNSWKDFAQSVDGVAFINSHYKKIMKTFNKADQKIEKVLVDSKNDFDMLDVNFTDLDSYAKQIETQTAKSLDILDQTIWSLWPADIADLSTTIDIKQTDVDQWRKVFLDEPLDTLNNSAKIQNNKADEKQRLLDLLSRALKQGNRR